MDTTKYKNNMDYPEKPVRPKSLQFDCSAAEATTFAEGMKVYEVLIEKYKVDQKAYRKHTDDLRDEFKKDLLEYLGITDHEKAEVLWNMAWEKGHSEGYHSVFQEAEELVELMV